VRATQVVNEHPQHLHQPFSPFVPVTPTVAGLKSCTELGDLVR
jgi:hypothetical protein